MPEANRPTVPAVAKKLAAILFLLLLILWAAGFVRTFTLNEPDPPFFSTGGMSSYSAFSSGDESHARLRMANNLEQIGLTKTPLPQVLEQEDVNKIRVYEKTAQLAADTTVFADDEKRARQAIAAHKAVVFSEKATGIAPQRWLELGISVHPDRFDALLHDINQVGQLRSIQVEQKDRTAEFRRVFAQRQSLKKHQEAILKLRGAKDLSVEESLKLEQKIVEIEKEIQAVGVQLGDFLGKEPSYNLFVTLQERRPGSGPERRFTLGGRLGSGFLWAFGWWALSALGIGLVVGTFVSVKTLWPGPGPATGS